MRSSLLSFTFICLISSLFGQMPAEDGILYGNEWIDYTKTYYKVYVGEDGIYRVTNDDLQNFGIDLSNKSPEDIQLWSSGKQVPIYTSSSDFSSEFYFDFFGEKHLLQLDTFLHDDWRETMFNDEYSYITDTNAYFITFGEGPNERYTSVDPDFDNNTATPLEYYIHEEQLVFTNRFFKPADPNKVQFSNFVTSEGFGNGTVLKTSNVDLVASNIYTGGPDNAKIQFKFGTNGVTLGHRTFLLNGTNIGENEEVGDHLQSFEDITIDLNLIKAGNNRLRVDNIDNFSGRHRLAYARLLYPRSFVVSGQDVFQAELGSGNFTFEVDGFNVNSQVVVYDPINKTRYTTNGTDQVEVILNRVKSGEVWMANEEGISSLSKAKEVTFTDISEDNSSFLFIYNQKLIDQAEPQYKSVIDDYMAYRRSETGGSHSTSAITMDVIEDQFGYGIPMHPQSISNLSHYLEEQWRSYKYCLIIGKGLEYNVARTTTNETLLDRYHVPTFGAPGSDQMLFTTGNNLDTDILYGRIAVTTAKEVDDYLNKVITNHEVYFAPPTIEDKSWLKRIIHLSGGGNPGEQDQIRRLLDIMRDTISTNQFGAEVTTFAKTSTTPLQPSTVAEIFDRINNGVSFITFFGHSSVGTFDFSIEEPSEYSNQGKLPIIISLGCLSGNIHSSSRGLSEKFVLQEETGSIAFFASAGTAFLGTQGIYGAAFYSNLGDQEYGNTIGQAINTTQKAFSSSASTGLITLIQQLTFHGDPAINVTDVPAPDYTLQFSSVRTEPTVVTAADDKYKILLDAYNIGTAVDDSIDVMLVNVNEVSEKRDTVISRIKAPQFSTTVEFEITNSGESHAGFNTIFVKVDNQDEVAEMPSPEAEMNNELINPNTGESGFKYFVADNTVKPLYPSEFGIVGSRSINFVAASNNGFSAKKEYIIELDTTELFDSPFKVTTKIEGIGGLIEWNTTIEQLEPNTVYYWRISPDLPFTSGEYLWQSSSFIYLPGVDNGWNQSHYYQYLKNDYVDYEIKDTRDFAFDTTGFFIKIYNGVWDGGINVGFEFNFETFALSVRPWNFMRSGLCVSIGDKTTGTLKINSGGDFGSINTSNVGSFRSYGYDTSKEEDRHNLMDLIDSVEEGEFVYIFSVFRGQNDSLSLSKWYDDKNSYGKTIFDVLRENGSLLVDRFEDNGDVPYSIVFQKGGEVIGEGVATEKSENIVTEAFIPVRGQKGSMSSKDIGPAASWNAFLRDIENVEQEDVVSFTIQGKKSDGTYDTLFKDVTLPSTDLSSVNAQEYRYLRVSQNSKDEVNRTATQLQYWRIIYDGLPDVGIKLDNNFTFRDSLQQGETLNLSLQAKNLTSTDMDSLLVRFSYIDSENNSLDEYKRFPPVLGNQEMNIDLTKNTFSFLNDYSLEVELNPNEDQVEGLKINNLGIQKFEVYPDNTNPIFDVTFDGYQILDNDIVSPQPLIKIKLTDENKYILLNEPKSISLSLFFPDGTVQTFDGASPEARFIAASDLSNNEAYLELTPELSDGDYSLKVQGLDNTGNASGDREYVVNFRVVSQKQVSEVLNYPNPFSTSTQFVFNLTGEIPTNMTIRIMTLSGRVVKEITSAEIGPLKIGRNISEYRWNGTDEFGNRLGNGVYLYQVVTKDSDGQNFEKLQQEQLNSFFTKGFGKMVIMR